MRELSLIEKEHEVIKLLSSILEEYEASARDAIAMGGMLIGGDGLIDSYETKIKGLRQSIEAVQDLRQF